jgi:uroporphyrin-3 C-methyltransferase
MNTDISMTEVHSSASKADQEQPARRGTGLALLAVVLALASLCVTGWFWWQNASEKQGEARQFAAELGRQDQLLAKLDARSGALASQLSALAAADPGQRLDQLEHELGSLQTGSKQWRSFQDETAAWRRSMQALMAGMQDRLAGTEARLAVLSARNIDSSAELDLDEVDYVLRLAQERLALFADPRAADRALAIAERHVIAMDNPMYIGLRRELSSARQKLALLQLPDYPTLERKLDLLQSSLASLGFKGANVTAGQPAGSDDSGWWARIRNAFSGLVTVRRSTADENEFPVLADQELIRQRAWLELEVARLAVLRRDQQAYSAALDRISNNVQRWFEPAGQGWQGTMDLLAELKLLNIAPAMPDISAPWTALQALRSSGVSADEGNGDAAP